MQWFNEWDHSYIQKVLENNYIIGKIVRNFQVHNYVIIKEVQYLNYYTWRHCGIILTSTVGTSIIILMYASGYMALHDLVNHVSLCMGNHRKNMDTNWKLSLKRGIQLKCILGKLLLLLPYKVKSMFLVLLAGHFCQV